MGRWASPGSVGGRPRDPRTTRDREEGNHAEVHDELGFDRLSPHATDARCNARTDCGGIPSQTATVICRAIRVASAEPRGRPVQRLRSERGRCTRSPVCDPPTLQTRSSPCKRFAFRAPCALETGPWDAVPREPRAISSTELDAHERFAARLAWIRIGRRGDSCSESGRPEARNEVC